MTTPTIEANQLLEIAGAESVSPSIIVEFNAFLSNLPWIAGVVLNWQLLEPCSTHIFDENKIPATLSWLRSMSIGRHSHITVAYSSSKPGLRLPVEVIPEHLSLLLRLAPDRIYAFGTDRDPEGWSNHFGDFMEVEATGEFRAIAR